MNSILLSIKPKYVELIADGEKTIEVRKSRPKLETPFKVYIYCTEKDYDKFFCVDKFMHRVFLNGKGKRKVIGEFVCDRIDEFHDWELSPSKRFYEEEKARLDLFLKESCLTYEEVCEYRKNLPSIKPLYGWHITDLKIYDKPKELSEFRTPCKMGNYPCCGICDYAVHGMDGDLIDCDTSLTRPPQSWCYVEPLKEKTDD